MTCFGFNSKVENSNLESPMTKCAECGKEITDSQKKSGYFEGGKSYNQIYGQYESAPRHGGCNSMYVLHLKNGQRINLLEYENS